MTSLVIYAFRCALDFVVWLNRIFFLTKISFQRMKMNPEHVHGEQIQHFT